MRETTTSATTSRQAMMRDATGSAAQLVRVAVESGVTLGPHSAVGRRARSGESGDRPR